MNNPQIEQFKGLVKHVKQLKVKEVNIDKGLLHGRKINLRDIEKNDYLEKELYTKEEVIKPKKKLMSQLEK
jgi:hypothetical protein